MADIKSIYGNPICDAKARIELADKADKTEVDEVLNQSNINKNDIEILKASISQLKETDDTKVDKVSGKGLSSNDYTDEEKEKLSHIEENANNYVLPSDVVHDVSYVHTDNNYTASEKNKLAELNNYDDTDIKADIAKKADKLKAFPQKTLSGNPIAITDALADEQPLKMRVYGDGIGDLNNGKYEIPIKITGKNMFDISKITKFVAGNYSTSVNGYFTKTDNIITSNIGLYGMSAYWYDSKIKFPPGTYTISADFMADKDSGNKSIVLGFKNLSDNTSSVFKGFTLSNYRTWERFSYTFEVSTESDIVPLIQAMGVKEDYTNLNIKIKNVQIEQGDTATEYEPYLEHTAAAMLDTPLSDGEYIDLASKKRNGETDITVNGNITLFDGANNITCQTEISPSKLEVSYYQDINKVLEELKNAILSQGGNV